MRLIGPRAGVGALKLIALMLAAVMLGGGGFLAWSKLRAATGGEAKSAEASRNEEGSSATATETLSLGEFLVNLRSSDGTLRYLQTEISIVVVAEHGDGGGGGGHGDAEDRADGTRELPPASHRYARDVAIEVLSSHSFEGLRDQEDRSKLKATLQQRLDAALETHTVHDVLFTAFVMQ
ncbi:MAG: flagellar basal body-associated FliL family protein [Armatimonadota bacterium]|jgi:flagellar FliL protein